MNPARYCDHVWHGWLNASLFIGNVMRLVLNLPMIGLWVKLLKVPKPQLYAGFLIFATVGAYGMRQSAIGEGSFMIFLQRPMSLSIFIVIVSSWWCRGC